MIVFDSILVMLAFAVLLLALARRFKLPYPVLLALAGTAVAVAQGLTRRTCNFLRSDAVCWNHPNWQQ